MDKDLEIKTVGQTKLDNAMHVTYHTEMHGILKSADQAKTGIPAEIMTDYNGGITEETELNREAQADALTAELVKADTARGLARRGRTESRRRTHAHRQRLQRRAHRGGRP